jgi:arginase
MSYLFTAAGCHQGQPHRGVAYGYTAVLSRIGKLENAEIAYNDCRQDDHFDDPIHGSYVIGHHIDELIESHPIENPICLSIGGDHTISFGTLMSSLRRDPDIRLIWIDAHSDINSPETSMSGNCHGMPVSYILGLSRHSGIDPDIPYLKPENLIYIGLRSIDPAEEDILKNLEDQGMIRFSSDYVRDNSIEEVIDILETRFLSSDGSKPNIHISLDIDSIDPEFAPATGTPVENGLHPTDVTKLIRWANRTTANEKVHLDITEINPDLSDLKGAAQTYATVNDVLDAYFG